MCLSSPKSPKAPPPPPEPLKRANEGVRTARDDTKKKAAASAGLAATNVTGGALAPSVSTQRTLLGS